VTLRGRAARAVRSLRRPACLIAAVLLLAPAAGAQATGGAQGAEGSAAGSCAPRPERTADRERLLARLAAAGTEAEGRAAEEAMWRFWSEAPDARSQALLDRVHDRRRWYDTAGAEEAARALVAWCPAYAEGWNQLATVLFERGRPDASLAAVAETLAREPAHFGALAGRAMILMRQGRTAEAQTALAEAVAIHPWLKERHLLAPDEEL